MTQDEISGAVKSANRVLDLFELLARWGDAMSHSDIADALAIPKSSLTQLLKTLVHRGYIEFAPATKTDRLGPAFAGLSQKTNDTRSLVELVAPILAEITEATRETSALNQLKGGMVEVVATALGPQRLGAHMRLGDVAPLYATSGGKMILAQLPDTMQREYLARVTFEPITPKTIRSRKALRQQLVAARKEGVAYSFEEFTPGIVGISVPILAEAGVPLGSLNVAMPSVRYSPATRALAIAALRAAVARIERQLRKIPR